MLENSAPFFFNANLDRKDFATRCSIKQKYKT